MPGEKVGIQGKERRSPGHSFSGYTKPVVRRRKRSQHRKHNWAVEQGERNVRRGSWESHDRCVGALRGAGFLEDGNPDTHGPIALGRCLGTLQKS